MRKSDGPFSHSKMLLHQLGGTLVFRPFFHQHPGGQASIVTAPEDTSAHRAGKWVVKLQRELKQIKHNPLPPHTHTHFSADCKHRVVLDIPEKRSKKKGGGLFSLFLCTHKTSTIYFSCYVMWWHRLAPQGPRLGLFFQVRVTRRPHASVWAFGTQILKSLTRAGVRG